MPAAGDGFRSTTRPTSATRSPGSTRSSFEDDAARDRARTRLLNAAKKYGIVPLGFIASQLDSERAFGERRALEPAELPTGFLTMLMTDVEDSSGLVERLGEQYRELIGGVRSAASGDRG